MKTDKPGQMEINISHDLSNQDNFRKVMVVKTITAELIRNSYMDIRYF